MIKINFVLTPDHNKKDKILSPKIDLDIESVVFDQRTCQLYMTISQVFSIWFIPFYKAPVRLITVLQLVPSHQQQNATTTNGGGNTNGSSTNGNQTPIHHLNGTDEDEPSYAEVLAGSPASPSSSARGGNSSSTHTNGSRSSGPNRYMIKSQDDHYQVNEFLKFILGVPGAYLWYIWQLLSTAACIVGVIIFTPIMGILAPYIAKRVRGRNNSAATPSRQKMS